MSTRTKRLHSGLCLALFLAAACETPTRPAAGADVEAGVVDAAPVQVLYGDVVVATVPGTRNLLVSLDGGEARSLTDGRVDYLYMLHRKEGPELEVFHEFRQSMIRTTPDGMIIHSRDGQSFGMFVESRVAAARRSLAPRDGMPGRSWMGYGLARRSGSWDLPSAANLEDYKALFACNRPTTTAPESPLVAYFFSSGCSSGGKGAAACSTTCSMSGGGCSVSCSSGYYACCQSGGCSCTCQEIELAPNIPG